MSDLASLNVKIDRSVKTEADSIANAMGMTLSTAINIFVRQMVNERAIPFRVQLMDDTREAVLARGREALREAQDQAIVNGTSEMTLDEINEIIAEVRQEQRGA